MNYGPGNDNITVDIRNGNSTVSGGEGIDTINLDYSSSYYSLAHYYYYKLDNGYERSNHLGYNDSITEIEDALSIPRLFKHAYISSNTVTDD